MQAWRDTPLHPRIVAMIEAARAAGIPPIAASTKEEARERMRAGRDLLGPAEPVRECRTVEVPTRGGTIPALLILPEGEADGVCVYLHGGGWVIGSAYDFELVARALAVRSRCAMLVPDYRLAPEHPFPAGLEDCEDSLLWASKQRREWLGNNGKLVVAGDSAGGNLAASAALRLRGRVDLAGQVLIYPVTSADFGRASYGRYARGLPLGAADMVWFFQHYAPVHKWSDPAITPLAAPDLTGCPPAVIALAEYDVLRDEGEAFAQKLQQAGLLAAMRRYEGVPHGFIRYHNLVDTADRAISELAADIRAFCRTETKP